MEIAAWRVDNYFEDHSIREGQPFSFLEAVGNFTDGAWTTPWGFPTGAGACEIATLLYRAALEWTGEDAAYDVVERRHYSEFVIIGERITITYIPHRNAWPDDLIGIWYNRDPELQNDFTVTLNEEVNPRGYRLYYEISMDLDGNFYAELEAR